MVAISHRDGHPAGSSIIGNFYSMELIAVLNGKTSEDLAHTCTSFGPASLYARQAMYAQLLSFAVVECAACRSARGLLCVRCCASTCGSSSSVTTARLVLGDEHPVLSGAILHGGHHSGLAAWRSSRAQRRHLAWSPSEQHAHQETRGCLIPARWLVVRLRM